MGKDVAKKEETLPVIAGMEEYIGAGTEGTDADDYALPFLKLLQKLSPELDEIEGSKAGQILNSVTMEVYDELVVIPCAFRKEYVEWTPKEKGGGLQGTHPMDSPLVHTAEKNDRGTLVLPNGNELVDTRYHYVLAVDADGNTFPAVMAMTSTQAKRSKRWLSAIQSRKIEINGSKRVAPSFAFTYTLTSVKEENDKGQWYSWVISPSEQVTDVDTFNEAAALYKASMPGDVKHSDESMGTTQVQTTIDEDDDIPL